jgi:endonuclease/exonuclease/phosphatase family metal-dependent hydrolase
MLHFLRSFRAWVALLALLALLAPRDAANGAAVAELKILSFNIWVNGGRSLSNCVEVIRTAGADIVGLQECTAPTAQIIASNLGFYAAPDSDASIVSRFRIIADISTNGGRGVAVELAPGQRIHFFNCHLTAYPYGPYDLRDGKTQSFVIAQEKATRMPALTQLLSSMAPYIAAAEPCFLTGDFNAPSHLDYAGVPWPTSIACTNAGLSDSYLVMHPHHRKYPRPFAFDDPGVTWTPLTNEEPKGVFDRIDFVYFATGDGVAVRNSTELDGRNSVKPWPSDHRAVLSTFILTPRR